jgi:hypothetical protein
MRAAAQATLSRGYTHFKLADAGIAQGSTVTGVIGSSSRNFSGTYGPGYINGTSSGFGSATVVRAPVAADGAAVVMFHALWPARL